MQNNRLGSVFGLFGNIDSNLGRSVVNPSTPATGGATAGGAGVTGRLGQAQSFAGSEQARLQREDIARQTATQQAQQLQANIAQEATAAQERDRLDRSEALREQEFKLQQTQFESQNLLDSQRQAEDIRNQRAQAAYQLTQQNGGQAPRHPGVFQPMTKLFTGIGYMGANSNALATYQRNYALASHQKQLDEYNRFANAITAAGGSVGRYADGSTRYNLGTGG